MPIEDGVFRRLNHPGIVVDSSKLEDSVSFKNSMTAMSIKTGFLDMATYLATKYVSIDKGRYQAFRGEFGIRDRYSLGVFVRRDDIDQQTRGTADSQALFTALLIEMRFKNDTERKVWIDKDDNDGHAIVHYEGKSGNYLFDPSKGDTKFIKQTP